MRLAVKNWAAFQHYKDRSPLWIKLHRGLLDNREYYLLSPIAGKCLPLIWLIASEKGGVLPSADELSFRLRIDACEAEDILAELVERGFVIDAEEAEHVEQNLTPAQRRAAENGFGSRHISDAVKRTVWERDGGVCKQCGSNANIEYDHIHPVSKGGNSGDDNIQLLCRPCNRSKRVSVATPAQPLRSLEKRREEKEKRKEESRTVAKSLPCSSDAFSRFKATFPRRDGANPWQPAEKKFNALVKTGVDPEVMIRAASELAREEGARGNIGTKFIPQAITWLNQQRFQDYAVASFGPEKLELDWDAICISYKKFGIWSNQAPGNDPSSGSCKCPPDILAKHGIVVPSSSEPPEIPKLARMQ